MRILIYSYNYHPEPIGIAPLMTIIRSVEFIRTIAASFTAPKPATASRFSAAGSGLSQNLA
jgi:hypothetical protein